MHEFIHNAARHAFARGKGSIRVELARAGAFVECRVLDDASAAANVQLVSGIAEPRLDKRPEAIGL